MQRHPDNDSRAANCLPFTKMEGIGNDYIYVETSGRDMKNLPELARRISDRHFGVGGDGLVLIGPSERADFSMRIFNADGSEAEMCGNASRCVGKYVHDRGLTGKTTLTLETGAGIRTLELNLADGVVETVRVGMGKPELAPENIPVDASGKDFINREITVNGVAYRGTAVSMGNPHFVVPVENVEEIDLEAVGQAFERHALFPRRINTEFVQVFSRKEIRMRVWERGSGETLACGTGACAAVVACALNGLTDRLVTVQLDGGPLRIEWAEDGTVYKTGLAAFVFDGEYPLPAEVIA